MATVEFLYLDQEAVLAADVLDMRRAMNVVGEAQARFAEGEVREPHKIVLRKADTAESEEHGRFNGLAAWIGAPAPTAIGMKWIASFPANRRLGRPRASGLIILNCPQTGVPLAMMEAGLISAMRTGAMTGLGVRYLARKRFAKSESWAPVCNPEPEILGCSPNSPMLRRLLSSAGKSQWRRLWLMTAAADGPLLSALSRPSRKPSAMQTWR